MGNAYGIGGAIIAFLTFVGCWIYAVSEWGFLLGFGLGWIPSFFIAAIAGAVGPTLLLLGIILALVFLVYWHGSDLWQSTAGEEIFEVLGALLSIPVLLFGAYMFFRFIGSSAANNRVDTKVETESFQRDERDSVWYRLGRYIASMGQPKH